MKTPFDLPAELTIYSALETRDAMLAWATEQTAASNSHLEVSGARVMEVDGSGLQLLAALSNMDLSWKLVDPSPVFAEACRTLGLASWLGERHTKAAVSGEKS